MVVVKADRQAIRFYSANIHLDDGSLAAGTVTCIAGEPLQIDLGTKLGNRIELSDTAHIALGRFDPHVHFRESATPTRQQVEELGPQGTDYDSLIAAINQANALYSIRSGSLAALHGGVAVVGAMGNTPWGPVGAKRHAITQAHYDRQSLLPIVVWPRMEPGAAAIPGHEGKDFGSTFGGSGLTGQARADMYALWKGEAVSYHNDQARSDETLSQFKHRARPVDVLLHHQYFNGDTVLACQAETMQLAKKCGIARLLARHISTGPALQQIVDASKEMPYELPAEIGLDYVYWCQERLLAQKRETALINYRRPAHPTKEDQQSLIRLARDLCRNGYDIFFGTDHAPHPLAAKAFNQDGLPGSPGTRNIEHSLQYYMELTEHYGYTWGDIDHLASINPAKHMARYVDFPYEVGTLKRGAMANLAIFDPEATYQVDESTLSQLLEDPHYHSALKGEKGLKGKSLFTVTNGKVWQVDGPIKALN